MDPQYLLTLMEHIAQGAVVQYHDLAEIWFDRAQVLDESAMPICTVLAVISTRKEFSLLL
jgi:hypothetical protein